MTDEQIAADVARLEPVVGKEHAKWYAEACRVTPADPNTTHAEVLWACRTRMALHVLGRDMVALADAAEKLVKYHEGGTLLVGAACFDPPVRELMGLVEAVKKALWWKPQ